MVTVSPGGYTYTIHNHTHRQCARMLNKMKCWESFKQQQRAHFRVEQRRNWERGKQKKKNSIAVKIGFSCKIACSNCSTIPSDFWCVTLL